MHSLFKNAPLAVIFFYAIAMALTPLCMGLVLIGISYITSQFIEWNDSVKIILSVLAIVVGILIYVIQWIIASRAYQKTGKKLYLAIIGCVAFLINCAVTHMIDTLHITDIPYIAMQSMGMIGIYIFYRLYKD